MKKISIVISVFNEESNIHELVKEINKNKISKYEYEIIFVNDGSSDASEDIISNICKSNQEYKLLSFTKNYGHEMAMSAGMDLSSGDAVIFMDADLQHPPKMMNRMIQIWENGKKIVLTKRIDNEEKSLIYKVISSFYYKILNYLSEFNMQTNTPDFRLIDRYYVDILKQFNENSRLFRGILYLIDSKEDTETIDFIAPKRFSGNSKYNFLKLLNLAIDSIIAFSIKPLRIALVLSSIIFIFSIMYGLFTLASWSMGLMLVPGLTTIYLLIIILGSGNLLVLSVIGEYIGRIHIESKNRPLYTIRKKVNFDE
jgi:dolichol-phosphate mannosyltransferase